MNSVEASFPSQEKATQSSQEEKKQAEEIDKETEKDSEKRSRSCDSVGREIKGEGVLKPKDSVKSLLRIRYSVGRVSVK
jgi:hypothetical protein